MEGVNSGCAGADSGGDELWRGWMVAFRSVASRCAEASEELWRGRRRGVEHKEQVWWVWRGCRQGVQRVEEV